jgi:N-carbamoyl-L-amino-acid hydrolase
MGGNQVCTVGRIDLHPNYINVIPARAVFTADLRNTDEALLRQSEARLATFLDEVSMRTQTRITRRTLARFEPVRFDADLVVLIEQTARDMGLATRRMTSGAGHDAQMMARICPAAMIFVPSVAGVSHNPAEHTDPADLIAGANVLVRTILALTDRPAR